jgi:hypothetical protein
MQYGAFILPSYGVADNASRFCFAPDVARPLLELEQTFFKEQHGGNGKIVYNLQTLHRD